jgi:hypothetical protein
MDKETKIAIANLLEMSNNLIRNTSEIRQFSLRIHDSLVQAQIPGYLEAYDSHNPGSFPELIGANLRLSHLVESAIQMFGKTVGRKDPII